MRASPPNPGPFHRSVAAVLAGAILWILALAVLPEQHEEAHCHAHEEEHVCAVTLFSHSQVDVADGAIAPVVRGIFWLPEPAMESGLVFPVRFPMQRPARGPPLSV